MFTLDEIMTMNNEDFAKNWTEIVDSSMEILGVHVMTETKEN